jgi:hypothetical protein
MDPVEPPRSALHLRRALATGGLVLCVALAVGSVAAVGGTPGTVAAVLLGLLALAAAADLVVIQRRLADRRARGQDEGGLFS